ncbi:MAG: cobyric acid synthase [Fibrobacterales bacterium]
MSSTLLKPIMFVGTGSDVGKSVINAAFCRIFKQDGHTPAPFKAQNMSLNSYATPEGHEIGRAQAMQAEAARIPCSVSMNPVLLKPNSNMEAQIVLNGKPWANKTALDYFNGTDRDFLFAEAMKGFDDLASRFCPVVVEGAGSISEVNLRDRDITNMRVAVERNADVYLITDIDKGGVFGSVYGTLELLPVNERALIKGIIINKFRGDSALFEDGRIQLEELTGVPVVGVIPYFRDIILDDEDSVILDLKSGQTPQVKQLSIVIVLLKQMSNFTDFAALERINSISVQYSANPQTVVDADIVIIPGSKNSISDLNHLRESGLATAILNAYDAGKSIYGICGGFQMMGKEIHDPHGIEGTFTTMPGLGILPVSTTLTTDKITEQCTFQFRNSSEPCKGYEIHMGETTSEHHSPLCTIQGISDGHYLNERVWGSYIHGMFDNHEIVNSILKAAGHQETIEPFSISAFKETQYNKLADVVRDYCDLEYIYSQLSKNK